MLNSPLIQDLIFRGEVAKIKEVMARSNRIGMKTFDQALFDLYEQGYISYEDALRNSDSKNELRLRIKLDSKRENKPVEADGDLTIVRGSHRQELLELYGARRTARAAPVRGADRAQHQAAVQADGGAQGLGPVLHLQRADQDQDRGPDLSDQQAGAAAGGGALDAASA